MKRTYKVAKEVFYEYLNEKGIPEPTEKSEFAQVLKKFYVEARKKDGSSYSMGSLKTIQCGLKRYLKMVTGFDIINDEGFNEANKVYSAKCVQLKKEGLANVQHKLPIANADLEKLYESAVFNTDSPKTFFNKVFFEIMLWFCCCGQQNLRQ
jgi:hypothetical protein